MAATAPAAVGTGDTERAHPQLAGVHRPHRGRSRRHRRPVHARRPGSPSPTARTSTTTTRSTTGCSPPVLGAGEVDRLRHRLPDELDGGPAEEPRLARAAPARPHPQPRQPRGPRSSNQAWDYGATYHLPWQAGITGIAYNPALTGRELTQHQRPLRPGVPAARWRCSRRCATPSGWSCSAWATTRRSSTRTARFEALDTHRAGDQRRPDPGLHRQRVPAQPGERRLRGLHRLVGRHRPAAVHPARTSSSSSPRRAG